MTMLFIQTRLWKQFEKRVRPIFESRGILTREDSFSDIQRCFSCDLYLWEVWLDVPAVGSTHRVEIQRNRPAFVFDCATHWNDRDWDLEGPVDLRVKSLLGRDASCELLPADGEMQEAHLPIQKSFMAISSDSLTILATLNHALNSFMAVDIWPNELIPLPIAAQRVGQQVTFNPDRLEFVNLSDEGYRFVTDCVVCSGDGVLTCDKCDGSGDYLPSRQCPKCGGSGNFIGKYGDVMGDCCACNGKGLSLIHI